MALTVAKPKPTGTLKVVSANGTGVGGVTYNPQQTYNPQGNNVNPQGNNYNPQKTYNPQQAATAQQLRNVTAQQVAAAALRQQQEQDRIRAEAAAKKKRLADAKNNEIAVIKGGIKSKILDKVSLGSLRRQRGGRELAVKYWKQNEDEWGTQIMSRQRNYENKGAQLKDWVMQADNEGEYSRRVAEANKWLDSEYKAIDADIKDFRQTQLELARYAQTPLSGKFAAGARLTKNFIGGVTSKSWGALTFTASQPQRAVNTVKNFVNPNNARQYYGGAQKSGGLVGKGSNPWSISIDQLKKSYNASANQRIVGHSKADEAQRLKGWTKTLIVDGKPRKVTRTPSAVDKFRVKYGDDVVDMMLDPLSWLGGAGAASKAGKASKADKLFAFAGKNKVLRNSIINASASKQWLANTKLGSAAKWLGAEYKPRGERANDAIKVLHGELGKTVDQFREAKKGVYDSFSQTLRSGNKAKSDFLLKQADTQKALTERTTQFRAQAEKLSQDYVKRLEQFNDREVRAITKFARNGKWSAYDKATISKARRADLTSFLEDYQTKAQTLAKSEGLKRTANNYLPEFTGRGYDPTARRTLFGDKYYGQGRQQLQESIIMRDFASNWDESNQYIKQLSATEKSILRNAAKTNRQLTEFERQQLQTIAQRKSALTKVKRQFGHKFDDIRDTMSFTRESAQPALKASLRGGIKTNFTKQGLKNSAADIFHLPMRTWKKSVLKYNPAWYVNNAAWNVPASVSAAGGQVFGEYAKLLTSRKYWNEASKAIPEGVQSKISREIGKGGLASKIEDTARMATFLALRKKGFSDEKALKQVNRWLFDYRTKNWERPIKGILPFWQWQKNLIRLGGTTTFHSPRSAKVYSELYKGFYQRPYDALPHDKQEYTDPETGEKQTYDPRKFYKGKAKIGDNWYGLPFFALNPETMMQFGVNPYLLSAADYLTSSDRLGNSNTDRKAWTVLGERFPQANVGRAIANRNNKDSQLYFADSGNSKERQGFDKSKKNYVESMDNRRKSNNTIKSFFGIPRGVKFDRKEFDTKKRLTEFNKSFFAIDWDKKEEADYKGAQKEKEALAKKYGFDLQKDIYDNYWSKYDTETTANTKRLKTEAAQFNSPDTGYWHDYFGLEKGSLTSSSKRRPFLIGKFDEWKRNHTFAKNPYYKLPKKGEINPFALKRQEAESQARRAAGKLKYQRKLDYEEAKRTGDWSKFQKKYGDSRKRTPFTYQGKFFKTAESRDKFIAGSKKHERGLIWGEYYALKTTKEKQAFLDKHPELRTFKQPQTQAEWDALRLMLRQQRKDKSNTIAGFNDIRQALKSESLKHIPWKMGKQRRVTFKV